MLMTDMHAYNCAVSGLYIQKIAKINTYFDCNYNLIIHIKTSSCEGVWMLVQSAR